MKRYKDALNGLEPAALDALLASNIELAAAVGHCKGSNGKLRMTSRVVDYELCPKKTWDPSLTWEAD